MRLLLEAGGVSVDVQDPCGSTALILASGQGHREVVEMLVGKGASMEVQNKNGWTALMTASQNGHGEVVIQLRSCWARARVWTCKKRMA